MSVGWGHLALVGLGIELVGAFFISRYALTDGPDSIWARAVNVRADAQHVNERGLRDARVWAEARVGFVVLAVGVVLQGVAVAGWSSSDFDAAAAVVLAVVLLVASVLAAVVVSRRLVRHEYKRAEEGRVLIGAERLAAAAQRDKESSG